MTDDPSVVIVNYKGQPAVRAWLAGLADRAGLPVTNVLDLALNEFAKRLDYPPMPRRQMRRGRPPQPRPDHRNRQ